LTSQPRPQGRSSGKDRVKQPAADQEGDEVQAARRVAWSDYALDWHRRAARDAERERHWFAAAFHLSRAIDATPADGSLLMRRGGGEGPDGALGRGR
jgi:hypothetical protein